MSNVPSSVTLDNRVVAVTPPPTRGNCPGCKVSLDGDGIWLTFYQQAIERGESKPAAILYADETCESYGAGREEGRWGRAIGIVENDRCGKHACPYCGTMWDERGVILDSKFDVEGYHNRVKELYG